MKLDVESCYIKYRDMVWRVALNHCANYAEAEDILQEVFLRYLKADQEYQDETHLKAWLLRVTMNLGKNLHLSPWKKRCLPLEEIAGSASHPAPTPPEREDYFELYQCLAKLKPADRDLIYLFYYEELPMKTIARILGKSEGSLRTRMYRLRKQLALELNEGEEVYEH